MTETNTLRLSIDAKAGQAGARKYVAALNSIKAALEGLDRTGDGAFTTLNKGLQATPKSSAKTELEGAATASKKAESAAKSLGISVQNAMRTSQGEVDRLKAKFATLGDASSIDQLEADFARLQARMAQARSPLDVRAGRADFRDITSQLTKEARAQDEAAKAAERHAAELEKLKARHIPLYNSSQHYAAALKEIDEAQATGILTSAQADRAREKATANLERGVASLNRYGEVSKLATHHATNLGFQLQDIAVMMAGGASPMQIMMTQGTQVAGIFQQLGGSGGVFATLKGALLGLVSPVSLITMGVIGMGAVLFKAISSVVPETLSLSDAMDNLKTSTDALKASAERTSNGWGEVRKQYGGLTEDIKELVYAQQTLDRITAASNLRKAKEALYSDQGGVGWLDSLAGYANNAQGRIRRLRDEFDLTYEVATRMESLFQQSRTETNASKLADLYAAMRRELEMSTDGFTNMTEEQETLLRNLTNAETRAREVAAATGDIAPGLTLSANEAARLANELLRAKSLQFRSEATTYSGRGSGAEWNYSDPTPGTKWTMQTVTDMERAAERAARASAKSASASLQMTNRLQAENIALNALKDGLFETSTGADLYAEAFMKAGGAVDSATMSALQQADAVAHANEQLRKIVQTNKTGGFKGNVESSVKSGFSQGLRGALNSGDFGSFFTTLRDSVTGAFADGIADALTRNMFKQTTSSTAGGILSGIMGIFGAGKDGGISGSLPGREIAPIADFANAPHFKNGTPNTSGGGIPSILHRNEAVIPLKNSRVPVELNGAGGGGDVNNYVTVNVDGGDQTSAELATTIARKLEDTMNDLADIRIAKAMKYGGAWNPRGGR